MKPAVALLAVLFALGACRDVPPPDYVRLSGAAPVVQGVPTQGAVLVVFWASWCPPCRTEAPALQSLARRPPEGLRVVTFSRDSSVTEVERFFGNAIPPELSLRMDDESTATRAFAGEPLPTSILVVDGRLVARFTGPREWDSPAMRRLLARLMAGG
ncbi:MAG: TlpA disulfide reductase family protein [Cystobacter sp.]